MPLPSAHLDLPRYSSMEEMEAASEWRAALAGLNGYLAESLEVQGAEVCLNGNLFYAHKDLAFQATALVESFAGKRRNLFRLAQASHHMFEVGVNGGHSLFLALTANPNLICTGVDVCSPLDANWARVDLYVPAAFRWLSAAFPGRTSFITGNSLIACPAYALNNPSAQIDLLHLDGAKDTHLREFLALQPVLAPKAHIIQDDSNTRPVRNSMRQILKLGLAGHVDNAALGLETAFGHRVLVAT